MKRSITVMRRAYLLVSDTAYYWRQGYRLRMAWHRAKQTIN